MCSIARALSVAPPMAALPATAAARTEANVGTPTVGLVLGITVLVGVLALAATRGRTRPRARDAATTSRRTRQFPLGHRAHTVHGPSADPSPVLGYATAAQSELDPSQPDVREQAEAVVAECQRRGLLLLELVHEPEDQADRKSLDRPGLGYALSRIAAGEASGLVVADVSRVSNSLLDFADVLSWFSRADARLVAVAQGLDTTDREGRRAAQTLIELSRWGRDPSERRGSGA